MATDIPTTEPASFYAGDTVTWVKYLEGYKSNDLWVLSYMLINSTTRNLLAKTSQLSKKEKNIPYRK